MSATYMEIPAPVQMVWIPILLPAKTVKKKQTKKNNQMLMQVLEFLPHTWETKWRSWMQILAWHSGWKISVILSVPVSLSLCLSNKETNILKTKKVIRKYLNMPKFSFTFSIIKTGFVMMLFITETPKAEYIYFHLIKFPQEKCLPFVANGLLSTTSL